MYRKTMREALEEARSYRDPVNEDKGFSSQQIKMAYGVLNDPRYKQGNYSGAYAAIEKIAKGLASHPDVANALKRANEELEESVAAREIDRTNTRRDSMDYQMYKKSADLLKKKDYVALGNHIYNADTEPREYVMSVISKKEPATFKKMYGNQTGYMSLMKPKGLKEETIKEYKKMTVTFRDMATMSKASTDLAKYGFTIDAKGLVMKVDGKGAELNAIGTDLQNFYGAKVVAENLEERFTKKEFDRNEDENDHSLNAIMLAKEFGTSQEIKDMEDIDKRHKQRGHINEPDYSKRNALVKKYYSRLK